MSPYRTPAERREPPRKRLRTRWVRMVLSKRWEFLPGLSGMFVGGLMGGLLAFGIVASMYTSPPPKTMSAAEVAELVAKSIADGCGCTRDGGAP